MLEELVIDSADRSVLSVIDPMRACAPPYAIRVRDRVAVNDATGGYGVGMTAGDNRLGPLLASFRQRAGISQRLLASRAGVSLAAIRDLEQGRTTRPRRSLVDAVVIVLELTADAEADFRQAAFGAAPDRPVQPAAGSVRIQILGALQVHRGPRRVLLGRGRRRAVLGRLALSANDAVLQTDLIDVLWGGAAPSTAAQVVQTYVSRLRAALQPFPQAQAQTQTGVVSRTPLGYRLNVDDEDLDLTDFRRRLDEARKAEPSAALEMFESALALWSGDPLHDVPELSSHPIVTAVLEERIAATLCYADLALAHCQPERCLPLLRALTAANPLHEPLHARLIAALAAGGLQASALDSYADISRRLVDELGIDPSPALVDTHRRVLRQQHGQVRPDRRAGHGPPPAFTSVRTVPSQLPFGVHGFIGRVEEIAQLNRYADTVTEAAVIVGLSGPAGVGKTALAVHWGHHAGNRFPDGCLYVNLNGYGPPEDAETPEEALRVLLDGLGVPPRRLPVGLDARAALFRSVIAGRRVLVVLDNARDAAQVRPLLPAAPGCLTLVTSRSSLTGLVAVEGAMSLPLDTLGRDEARALLTARLGRSATALESAAVEEVIDGCAGLPLALAITAARAAVAPRRSLAVVARGLRQGARRLDSLASPDATIDIRAVFSWSYRLLRRPTARLFRLLGLHTGGSVSAAVAASLAGDRPEEVAAALDELVEVNLLVEVEPGRYAFHDLLMAFSRELISTDPEASAGVRRLLDHYLHTSAEADRHLDAFRWTVPLPPLAPGVRPETIDDRDEALAWFTGEHAALMASVALAAASEDPAVALHPTRTARNMENYALRAGRWGDVIVASRTALAAASRRGDRIGQALAQHGISRASGYLGDTNGARDAGLRAAVLYREAGMHVGQADAYRSVATALHNAERFAEAVEVAERQVELYTTHGTAADQAQGFNTYGYLLAGSGRYAEALEPLDRALKLQNSIDDVYGAAFTLDSLGLAYLGTHRLAEAEDHYRGSLELFARIGDRYNMVYPTCGLGDVLAARGDTADADGMYRRARRLCQEAGLHHLAATVEDRLRAG
ncbi:BTAD domain-containing putative transcriptional regulator [Dactylosporangium siamense]|uniref:SARP family transcriptional regulator n=1 Tax=Dactylosporangium siamense TaxID=685454 RepID=A0A919UDK0_9ACTN|nr:BTAD domain-containing putative transcriptional regulator [Dactylosporangium siamense]GIG47996.1 SARP family transcriptional regulator [Dactylosporangium siamense]